MGFFFIPFLLLCIPPSARTMSIRRVAARGPWETKNPFLFAIYHADAFPAGNGRLGPTSNPDGTWQMYHGDSVPGFPHHPHRGFETLTLVLAGTVDHGDSAGNYGRYGSGDLQWMTAGKGLCHSEMFPLIHTDKTNPLVLFQIWLNLPAASKMTKPTYVMQWAERIPTVRPSPGVKVVVHAGPFGDSAGTVVQPAECPPASMAANPDHDVAVWRVTMNASTVVSLPPARDPRTLRTLFLYHGSFTTSIRGKTLSVTAPAAVDLSPGETGVVVTAGAVGGVSQSVAESLGDVALAEAVTDGGAAACFLVLQGIPLAEPVVQRGPFVATSEAGITDARLAFQRGEFGRWPFADLGPTFGGSEVGRFAFKDGVRETP